jgi:hypothetical protein
MPVATSGRLHRTGVPGHAGRRRARGVVRFGVMMAMAATTSSLAAASAGGPPALPAVLSDAARRTGVDTRSLQIVRTEPRDWPNSGLGCPRPGEMYAQMVTPGWLIEVRSGQRTLEYHTDAADHFVLCTRLR